MPNITPEEYRAFQAKQMRGVPYKPGYDQIGNILAPVETESDLHNQIIDYCKSKGWQYLHGSMAHRSRRTIGENDFTILADGGRVFLVEVKTKSGKLSPEQNAFIAHARRNGHTVHVIRSMDDFRVVVE